MSLPAGLMLDDIFAEAVGNDLRISPPGGMGYVVTRVFFTPRTGRVDFQHRRGNLILLHGSTQVQPNQGSEYVPNSPFVLLPGDVLQLQNGSQHDTVQGYKIYPEPRVPVSAVEEAKAELNARMDELRAEHAQEVEALLEAIKGASVDALREAALDVLTDAIARDLIDEIPERLTRVIEERVQEVLAEATGGPPPDAEE